MSREEYLRALSRELRRLPKDEYEKAMDYYVEYFEDAGPEKEQAIIAELGAPRDVAAQIIMDAAIERMDKPAKSVKRGLGTIWIVLLALCAAPVALPVVLVLLACAACVLAGIAMVLFGAFLVVAVGVAAGIVEVVCGVVLLGAHPASGMAAIGLGLAFLGLSILGGFLVLWVCKWIMIGIRALFRGLMRRRKKA